MRRSAAALWSCAQSFVCWLAVVTFLIFSLLMPGTMLERDASGRVTVVLCAAAGPTEMVVSDDSGLHHESEPAGRHGCDWGPHSQPGTVQPVLAALMPGMEPLPLRFLHGLTDGFKGADVVMPSARGPPGLI